MAEWMSDEEYYAQLNTVNLASGALIKNPSGEVLIVNPRYRDQWLIPGGCVDKDESPSETCRREVKEETGLDLNITRLLSVEYLARRDYKPEAVHFIFYGGILDEEQVSGIRLCERELSEFRFCPIDEACELLDPDLSTRFRSAWDVLQSEKTAYLERGMEAF